MPRQPRLDSPGALHHVMGRGINGVKICDKRKDRKAFLERLADLCGADLPLLSGCANVPPN
jgi:putative transposase